MNTLATPAAVRDFWFGDGRAARPEWFRKDPAFDESIRERFGATVEAALAGGLRDWGATPQDSLARILVLDQFPRNLFRGSARAFAGDAMALAAAQALVAGGHDRALAPLQRWFVYLPYEHAEDLALQHEAVRLFEALAADAPAHADAVVWARKHLEVIQRFGRFPHRNAALGRASTPEEAEYLRQPGAGF